MLISDVLLFAAVGLVVIYFLGPGSGGGGNGPPSMG